MQTVSAIIITIGDEILYGQTVDTNSAFLGGRLTDLGIRILEIHSIRDDREDILKAAEQASKRADIIVFTGGLGPTKDDITKKTLCEYFNTELIFNEEHFEHIKQLFSSRDRMMNEHNRSQAYIPEAAERLHNPAGTAAGMWFEQNGKVFISMPGVPYEMKGITDGEVIPRLQEYFDLPVIVHRKLQTVGVPESVLADIIQEPESSLPDHIRLAYLPRAGRVTLRFTAFGSEKEALKKNLSTETEKFIPLIEKYIFGYDDITLEEAVSQMLKDEEKTLSVAESCTGGLVAHSLTKLPGASEFFMGSVTAYHNEVKAQVLSVSKDTLDLHGAVSEQCALEMAEGVRLLCGTDFGLATTGVAGPGGGKPEKPVGTVWIAFASPEGAYAKKLQLTKKRDLNISLSTTAVLDLLRRQMARTEETVTEK